MNDSLCILLPVHNAERTLGDKVSSLLEIAAELTGKFEIAIIDDGSTDATEEVACELARDFPQVIAVRHPRQRGNDAAIETGMAATTGAIALVLPQDAPLQPAEMRRLWTIGSDYNPALEQSPIAQPVGAESATVVERLLKWGRHLKQVQAERSEGLRLIRRDRYEKRHPAPSFQPNRLDSENATAPAPNFLTRLRDFALGE